jgi:hypothetical protein
MLERAAVGDEKKDERKERIKSVIERYGYGIQ